MIIKFSKKWMLLLSLTLFTGCGSTQPLTPIGKAIVGVAEANSNSKADVELDIITPQGTLHYRRHMGDTNSPAK